MRWCSAEKTGNCYFCASVMLLSHLLSHIKLFKGGFAHIKEGRKEQRKQFLDKLRNWSRISLQMKWIGNFLGCVGWTENESERLLWTSPIARPAVLRHYFRLSALIGSGWSGGYICGCVGDLWTFRTVGTCCNKQAFRCYLIWAFLNSLLSCVYCSVIITRIQVYPLWENRQGVTSTSMPDLPRDFYATFRKGNITLSCRQALKDEAGAKFTPMSLIIFSD